MMKIINDKKRKQRIKYKVILSVWLASKLIYKVALLYVIIGGATGLVWNPVNQEILKPYLTRNGFNTTLIDIIQSFSLDNGYDSLIHVPFSLFAIYLLVLIQLKIFILLADKLEKHALKKLIWRQTKDRVALRHFNILLARESNFNEGVTSKNSLIHAEKDHWKKWTIHYKSEMSFEEWKEKIINKN